MSFFKKNKGLIFQILQMILAAVGGGAAVLGGAYATGVVEFEEPVAMEIQTPVETFTEGDGTVFNRLEIWCNCAETTSDTTNIAGSERQPFVPYEHWVSEVGLKTVNTNLPISVIGTSYANKFKVCGEGRSATDVIKIYNRGRADPKLE